MRMSKYKITQSVRVNSPKYILLELVHRRGGK